MTIVIVIKLLKLVVLRYNDDVLNVLPYLQISIPKKDNLSFV